MPTYTKLESEHQESFIVTSAAYSISEIDPLIYGGFIEHIGRCIYTGIYDPENTNKHLIDEDGFRKDVIESLKELQVPVMRYPGGNFVATYRWLDGVGPRESRPKKQELAWSAKESNHFGTDEFMRWCSKVGAEPYLTLNMGTGTLEEALGWVEYCNFSADTYYANLRRLNGRQEPYKVKYWALGNEMWGPWQIEQHSKEDYAKKAIQWGKALKRLDPSITLILCGQDGYSDWDRYVLQQCLEYCDMHSIHLYTTDKEHLPNATAPLAAERAIQLTASLIDLARIETDQSVWPARPSSKPRTKHRPAICFDEWNVWDSSCAPGDQGAEQMFTVSDALAVATWLNVLVRQSQYLGMANIAQSVNVISPLMTTPTGIIKQPPYWVVYLFSKFMRGKALAVHLGCQEYTGRTNPEWIASTMNTPWLDVSAALHTDGLVSLAVVNIHETKPFNTRIEGGVASGAIAYTIGGADMAIDCTNTEGNECVSVSTAKVDLRAGKYEFPPKSLTILRWIEHNRMDGFAN